MRKFFLCLLCNGQPNEKKTFQRVMKAEAFQVKKDLNRPTNDKGKAFPSSFPNAFWSDNMRSLKSKLSNIR